MIEGVLLIAFITSVALASGIPQHIFKKNQKKIVDSGIWIFDKWYKISSMFGIANPSKILNFEKCKIEHNIEGLISIVAAYDAALYDINYHIKKHGETEELISHKNSIENKLNLSKLALQQKRQDLSELVRFINESTADSNMNKIRTIPKEDIEFLEHQVNVNNIKDKKDV